MKPFAVVALVVDRDSGFVLSVSRKHDHEDFGLPGGKIDPGEGPLEAVCRELREETGLLALEARPCFERQERGGLVLCFFVSLLEGKARSREGAVTKWIPWSRLTDRRNTFHLFNRALERHLMGER